jgi:hypothetical protein
VLARLANASPTCWRACWRDVGECWRVVCQLLVNYRSPLVRLEQVRSGLGLACGFRRSSMAAPPIPASWVGAQMQGVCAICMQGVDNQATDAEEATDYRHSSDLLSQYCPCGPPLYLLFKGPTAPLNIVLRSGHPLHIPSCKSGPPLYHNPSKRHSHEHSAGNYIQ